MAPKAVDARNRFNRNDRFRGQGPLLQEAWPISKVGCASTGGYTRGAHLVRTSCGYPAAGHRPERREWPAPLRQTLAINDGGRTHFHGRDTPVASP
jgi:hypothetical protein